jgi:hypothetical protein
LVETGWARFRPQTGHLRAVSLTREPQVGQSFWGVCLFLSSISHYPILTGKKKIIP